MTVAVLLLAFLAGESRDEAVEGYLEPRPGSAEAAFDPTDPTRVNRGLWIGAEWIDLTRGEGEIFMFHLAAAQPLGARDRFGVEIDLPFGFSDTDRAGSRVGLGDLRLAFSGRAWEAADPGAALQVVSLRADLMFPTGSASRSLGAGDWVVAPAMTLQWRMRQVRCDVTARWIYADGVNVSGIRGFNIPGVDALSNTASRSDLNALDLEASFAWEFDRPDSPVHWFSITPDWTSNFAGDRNNVLLLKTRIGRAISRDWYFDLDFWFPIFGERTQSFTLRFAFVWEF